MTSAREYLGAGQQGTKVPAWYLIALVIVAAVVGSLLTAAWNGVAGVISFVIVIAAGLGAFAITRHNSSSTTR